MTNSSEKHENPAGEKLELAAEELIAKLRKALDKDGDFPASAKVVAELRQLASNPNTSANQITEVILKEPSLGARVLHTVNSSYYHRGTAIMTVSQAVLRLGMKMLADLCAGLVLLQKFVPASRRGGAFAACLRKMVVTSLLSASINETPKSGKTSESGYLAGALAEIGTLLLAYYFPQVFENALRRSETKHQDLSRSIYEITGVTPLRLSTEVLDALSLPDFYKEALKVADSMQLSAAPSPAERMLPPEQAEILRCARTLKVAQSVSEALTVGGEKGGIDSILGNVKNVGLDDGSVRKALGELPEMFRSHCSLIEVDLPPLPEYVASYGVPEGGEKPKEDRSGNDPFKQFVDEVRQAVENREPTASIITSVMETLVWGLKFERVMLLLLSPSKSSLVGRMLLGSVNIDPKKVSRPLGAAANPKACEALAFRDACPIYRGVPLLEGGWPFAAIPIGSGHRTIGVIYADRASGGDAELTSREQAAISVLVELLERSVNAQA